MSVWRKKDGFTPPGAPPPGGGRTGAAAASPASPAGRQPSLPYDDFLGDEAEAERELDAQREAKRRRRRVTRRRVVPAVLAAAAYAAFTALMFINLAGTARGGGLVSLRYAPPLDAAAAAQAIHTTGNPDLAKDFTAAYWYESPAETITTARGTAESPVLFVDGDMQTVMPVVFLHGTYPGALESRGLALSEGLAWELLGGVDAVGAEIEWNGRTWPVRGVFRGDEKMMLAQVDAADGVVPSFSGVELAGAPEGDPREAAQAYVQLAGLSAPSVILVSGTPSAIVAAMAWAPFVVLCLWLLVRLLILVRHANFWLRQAVWFGAFLALAILIPWALDKLPGWVIPTQWSDMDHWSMLFTQLGGRVTEWLSIAPNLADVQLKKQLVLQALLLVPTLFALAFTIFRWNIHMRRAGVKLKVKRAAAKAAAANAQPAGQASGDGPAGGEEGEGPDGGQTDGEG